MKYIFMTILGLAESFKMMNRPDELFLMNFFWEFTDTHFFSASHAPAWNILLDSYTNSWKKFGMIYFIFESDRKHKMRRGK